MRSLAFSYLLLFPLLSFSQQGSSFAEFAPIGAKWNYHHESWPIPQLGYIGHSYFESLKDTLFLGKQCRQLYAPGTIYAVDSKVHIFDSSGVVQFYSHIDTSWCFLYDFNAEQGDTIHLPCFDSGSLAMEFKLKVDSVSFININGFSRKRLNTSYVDPNWSPLHVSFGGGIEGIGSPSYLFPGAEGDFLRCYEDSVLGFYKSANWTLACDTSYTIRFVGIGDLAQNPHFNIYPNPASDHITISGIDIFNVHTKALPEISIYNSLGEVFRVEYHQEGENVIVNTSLLASGVYFLKLTNDKGSSLQKVLIE